MSDKVSHIEPPKRDRFWDGFSNEQFSTEGGFLANIRPTVSGNSTSLINKEVKISLELAFQDGSREIRDVAGGILSSIKTSRNSEIAELGIEAISKPMQDVSAERVKDGAAWYQNYPMSIILNELMSKVYKGSTGDLAEDKTINRDGLVIGAQEGKLGFWNLGIAPSWDGTEFEPAPNATPITAMVPGVNNDEVYVALGGIDGTHPAELWLYQPDSDVWTRLGVTAGNKPIQELFFNKKDNLIYGVIWEDVAETNARTQDPDNRTNWIAPPAVIFWWSPFGEPATAKLDDSNHSKNLGNIFPGQWDIREMYPMNSDTPAGRKEVMGAGYHPHMTVPAGDEKDNVPTHKTDSRASAGNLSAFKYVSMPMGPAGMRTSSEGPQEWRRAVPRYHPRPKPSGWTSDDIVTAYPNSQGEMIPNTVEGQSTWESALGITPPSGWSSIGSAAFSRSGGILTIDPQGDSSAGMRIVFENVEDRATVYRFRMELISNAKIYIHNELISNTPDDQIILYGPRRAATNSLPYSLSNFGNGDYFFPVFSVGSDRKDIHMRIFPVDPNQVIEINNLSLTVARYWDQWHSLDTQAGPNIPIVNYSKVVVGCHMRTPTHEPEYGPGFSFYDPAHSTPVYDIQSANDKRWIDEIYLEACLLGQDRRLLNGGTFPANPPMFSPNEAEDGIPPDNYIRLRMAVDDYSIEVSPNLKYMNRARILDLAPSVDQFSLNEPVFGHVLEQNGFGEQVQFERARAGHGYLSINLQTIGGRSLNTNDFYRKGGIVRFTNGQQGLFTFSQEANNGKGAILYCRPDFTLGSEFDRFFWGPGTTRRFRVQYSIYLCGDDTINNITGIPTQKTLPEHTPMLTGGEAWSPIYPTAGVADDQGNFYVGLVEAKSITPLYNGSNAEALMNESFMVRVAVGMGAFSTGAVSVNTIYSSFSDTSQHSSKGGINQTPTVSYGSESAVNKTRKFNWLHFNPDMGNHSILGWCFKRDTILTDPSISPALPCHELFSVNLGVNNRLTILDHDVQDGSNFDATAFLGFVNTTGEFAKDTYPDLEGRNVTWYFRYKKPTVNPQTYFKIGFGVQLCYMYIDGVGDAVAGQFWDPDARDLGSVSLRREEGFLSNRRVVNLIMDRGEDTEREALFSSFDHTMSIYHLSREGKENAGISSKLFFKLDELDVDPRVRLYDFTDLQVWDAFSKLATAKDFVFGFDATKFFLLPRTRVQTTHEYNAVEGDVIDIEKETSNEIRNVITIQPYREQMPDVDWEVTHVGPEEVLLDDTLFNGEFVLHAATPKKASINLICSRPGRLIVKDRAYEPDEDLELQDSTDDIWERNPPMFKWLTHAPTKEVTLMQEINSNETNIYVNTLYFESRTSIVPGELVIFSNPDTFEQIGIVIKDIDPILNRIILEKAPGFPVERLTPLKIVSSNIGAENSGPPQYASTVRNWSNTMSDQGVAIITLPPQTIDGKTVLTVNNITPFIGVSYRKYEEGYKHYPFLITVYSSSVVATATLPDNQDSGAAPLAWLENINIEESKLILNKNYSRAFQQGDVINAHYVMPPSTDWREPPPQISVSSPLPNGLGGWSWLSDPTSDRFNINDIINLKFPGLQLTKEDGSIFTLADFRSINKYGEKAWQVPDNRFIDYFAIEDRGVQYLREYSQPFYEVKLTIPFDPSMSFQIPGTSFLRKIEVIDPMMFRGFSGFKVGGRVRATSLNMASLKMELQFKTDERL